MAGDKRTILSSKRARGRRKKAQQKERATATASTAIAMQVDAAHSLTPTGEKLRAKLPEITILRQGDEHPDDDGPSATDTCESDSAEDDDDDELVIVCREAPRDFCSRFVSLEDESAVLHALRAAHTTQDGAPPDRRAFTLRVRSFRETDAGFVAFSVVVATLDEPRQELVVERRFSEFVALAAAIDGLLEAPERWELPPKTWFRVTQAAALEERRSRLESSLQTLLGLEKAAALPAVRDFLMLDVFGVQVAAEDKLL